MKRFIRDPQSAQRDFSIYAYRIDPRNMKGSFMRSGIRI